MVAEKNGPGRPRDPDLDRRIFEVTLQMMAEIGYARMSMDQISATAGVGKAALYRRWQNKADLATAALHTLQLREPAVNTGSTYGDLAGILSNFRRSLLRRNGLALIGNVLVEEQQTPELLAWFRERIVAPRRAMLRAVLERARQQGEIREGADLETAAQMMVGAFYAHYLADSKIPAEYPERVVAMIWQGLAR